MTVEEFEARVWEVEDIRIVIRAPAGEEVDDYGYENAREANHTLAALIDQRIRPCIGDREVIAINGSVQRVHRGTRLRTIRTSYPT